jgi:hypothetical protein
MTTATVRDREIVLHIQRFRLSTNEVLQRLFFPGMSLNAVRKVTARLVQAGWLLDYPLYERRKYYVLSRRAVRRLDEHRRASESLGYQALVNAYGVLSFCAAQGVNKFTSREFRKLFPDLWHKSLPSSSYYIDVIDNTAHLGYILVDQGAKASKFVAKVRRVIRARYAIPSFFRLIQSGRFLIAIVTASSQKKADIEDVLRRRARGSVRFRVEVITELMPLLLET